MLLSLLVAAAAPVLTLDLAKPGIAVSPTLYGLMTEEINYSYDGGLYGELIRNRSFKDDPQRPAHWSAVGDGSKVALDRGVTGGPALPVSLRVQGAVANEGYWGIPVRSSTAYRLEVWAKSDAPGSIRASIESPEGKTVFASALVRGVDATWRKLSATLVTGPDAPLTKDARLVLHTDDGRTVWLSLVSLFPPTFNERPNGNRRDLMQLLVDMNPAFLRFPGGNYVEGNTFQDRFPWKETLGAIQNRPGHMSPWGYRSSDGMGLLEYLEWCEDMKAKPLLALFAGYVIRGDVIKPGTELEGFVQDGLDEIEYVIGDAKTKWGAKRIRDGHPKPFPLECVEIGNEDGFDLTGSYEGRFVQFYDAIKRKYPKLKVISTTGGKDWLGQRVPIKRRKPDLVDEHYYASTWEMMAMANKYDAYDRNGPKIFVGEWASQDVPAPWVDAARKGPTPNMNCAIADAAFMTGLERNSDLVRMACYAPLLVNVNPGGRQWAVNLIGYDALNSFGSPSYYAQKLFSKYLGDRTVSASLSGGAIQTQGDKTLPGLFASATRDTKSGAIYLKVVNPLPQSQDVVIDLRGAKVRSTGTLVVLSGDPKAMNSIAEPKNVVPVTTQLDGLGPSFHLVFAPHSVTVLQLSSKP
jgi:alpha-N-arabinofuranosidase